MQNFKEIFFVLTEVLEVDETDDYYERNRRVGYSNGWTDYNSAREYFENIVKTIRSRCDYFETILSETLTCDHYEIHYGHGSMESYTISKMCVHMPSADLEN